MGRVATDVGNTTMKCGATQRCKQNQRDGSRVPLCHGWWLHSYPFEWLRNSGGAPHPVSVRSMLSMSMLSRVDVTDTLVAMSFELWRQ